MTTTIALDAKRYGRLLAKALPGVIKSDDENNRVLGIIEKFMEKGEQDLTAEEDALLELLISLAHDYEKKRYPLTPSLPSEMVGFLLEQRGLKPSDLWPVLGSRSRVSELLSGKRAISKDQARKLAGFFHVGVELFI